MEKYETIFEFNVSLYNNLCLFISLMHLNKIDRRNSELWKIFIPNYFNK